jgi:hypothetical protein
MTMMYVYTNVFEDTCLTNLHIIVYILNMVNFKFKLNRCVDDKIVVRIFNVITINLFRSAIFTLIKFLRFMLFFYLIIFVYETIYACYTLIGNIANYL